MASSARKTNPTRTENHPIGKLILAAAVTALSAFLLVSMASFDPADPPTHLVYPPNTPAHNLCGPVGAWSAYHMVRLVGMGSWLLVLVSTVYALLALGGRRISFVALRFVGILMLAVSFAGFQSMLAPNSGPFPDLAGGVIGKSAAVELGLRFGPVGSAVWLLLLAGVGAIVAFDKWVFLLPAWIMGVGLPASRRAGAAVGAGAAKMGGGLATSFFPLVKGKEPVRIRLNDIDEDPEVVAARTTKRRNRVKDDDAEDIAGTEAAVAEITPDPETPAEEPAPRKRRSKKDNEVAADAEEPEAIAEVEAEAEPEQEAAPAAEEAPGAPQVFDPEALRAKIAKLPIAFGASTKQVATEEDLRDLQNVAEMPGYKFPGLDLLEEPEQNFSEKLEEYVREQAAALEAALQQYRIEGHVVEIESGPVITLYHVALEPGTKVSQLQAIASDVARSLKAVNIRIVSNMAGRDTVGVEVPNSTKEKVRLKELMSKSESFSKMKLPMFLGKDAAGEPLIADLAQMPHMLIAGTTGSGKSVCMNTIIMSFLYTKKPNELKLVLVDPKMVEMSQFKDIPHLMCPVVTEMGKAAAILEWATQKMDERYELLAEAGCRDLAAYNELPWEELKARFNPKTPEEEARIPRKLPYMVFVIDELADLIITTKEVEGSIIRIAQKARAVGIHLILATQRPQANVVTGLIKSNMPCRVCFKVASGMDSRIVLDQKGGELLLGQGDMLYLSPRTSKLIRAQGTLVDDSETRKVVRFMRDIAQPSFERQLMTLRKPDANGEGGDPALESANNSSASLAAAQEDPLFHRAVEVVLETKRGSVSLLQRRLAIGYTRASRLIDLMGIAGIISDHKGSVARDVQITAEEWEAMKKQAEADAAAQAKDPSLFDANSLTTAGTPPAGPDVGAQDTSEATAIIEAEDKARTIVRDEADEFPDAFKDEEGNDREAPF